MKKRVACKQHGSLQSNPEGLDTKRGEEGNRRESIGGRQKENERALDNEERSFCSTGHGALNEGEKKGIRDRT